MGTFLLWESNSKGTGVMEIWILTAFNWIFLSSNMDPSVAIDKDSPIWIKRNDKLIHGPIMYCYR